MRNALIALALAVAAPAVAEPFPRETEIWFYEGRATAGGVTRFARLDGSPDRRGGWIVKVTCGVLSTSTSHELVDYTGSGSASRDRWGYLGGTMTSRGRPTMGWSISQTADGILAQAVEFAAPGEDTVCPNSRGDFGTWD